MTNNPAVERIAANVRAELARKGITQTDLALRLKKSQPFVSRRLSGSVPFNVADLDSIATVLDISIASLVEVAA